MEKILFIVGPAIRKSKNVLIIGLVKCVLTQSSDVLHLSSTRKGHNYELVILNTGYKSAPNFDPLKGCNAESGYSEILLGTCCDSAAEWTLNKTSGKNFSVN